MKNIAIVYLRPRKDSNKEGAITVALKRTQDKFVDAGVAFCSPKDQFIKSKGRKIALGRLHRHKSKFHLDFLLYPPEDFRTVLNRIRKALLSLPDTPRWAKKMLSEK